MAELRVLFIGAGAVNFGGAEGPWDNSRRLEGEGGVLIVAIADPDTPKAEQVQLSGRASAAVLMESGGDLLRVASSCHNLYKALTRSCGTSSCARFARATTCAF